MESQVLNTVAWGSIYAVNYWRKQGVVGSQGKSREEGRGRRESSLLSCLPGATAEGQLGQEPPRPQRSKSVKREEDSTLLIFLSRVQSPCFHLRTNVRRGGINSAWPPEHQIYGLGIFIWKSYDRTRKLASLPDADKLFLVSIIALNTYDALSEICLWGFKWSVVLPSYTF